MALRARRRQGGSSSGTQHNDPRNPNRSTTGIGSTNPPRASTNPPKPKPKPKAAAPVAVAPKPAAPAAAYVRRPPPAPSAPVRGATSEAMRANAASALGIAKTQNRDAIFRAIMQLGDPTQFAAYQANPNFAGYQFTQDPNSIFASLARQEQKGLEDIDVGANAGNTFFSGMRNRDRGELTDETGRQRLAGTTSFLDDLKAYAASLGLSENDYNRQMTDADQMDIDAALERDRIAREEFNAQEDLNAAAAPAGGDAGGGGAAPPLPVVPGMTPAQVQEAITFLSNPNFGQDMPGMPGYKGYDEKPGKDSKGNPGTWHIYPDGHKVFVRKK